MSPETLQNSLVNQEPPDGLSPYLQAMWYDAKDDWETAHTIVQDLEDVKAAWVHAYLHRKEGDIGNADYWYRRAGRKRPATSLEEEWKSLVSALS